MGHDVYNLVLNGSEIHIHQCTNTYTHTYTQRTGQNVNSNVGKQYMMFCVLYLEFSCEFETIFRQTHLFQIKMLVLLKISILLIALFLTFSLCNLKLFITMFLIACFFKFQSRSSLHRHNSVFMIFKLCPQSFGIIQAASIGEGNGNPLQYSCLENPRDGGAWWAAIYGVAQSRT